MRPYPLLANRLVTALVLLAALRAAQAFGQTATPQTITWTGTSKDILAHNAPYPLGATATSGLPVILRVERGPAMIANGAITVTNRGTVWIAADQAGNDSFLPAHTERIFNLENYTVERVGGYDTLDQALGVQVTGNYAYVADGNDGFLVFDITEPSNPTLAAALPTAGTAFGVKVAGNYAYLAVFRAGLEIIDIGNPIKPVRVGSLNTGGNAFAVEVSGNHAYVANNGGLQIIDITNPANPVRVGEFTAANSAALAVQVIGNYAYLAGLPGLRVLDVSDPTQPVSVGEWGGNDTSEAVQVAGAYAYLDSYKDGGVDVLDVSNPREPRKVGFARMSAFGIQLAGDKAFFAAWGAGLQAYDVSNPAKPINIGGFPTDRDAHQVQVVGDYAYVVASLGGLHVFRLSLGFHQPQELTWTGTADDFLALNVPYPLGATASSGLPVSLRVQSGPAEIKDGTITMTGAGTVWITAEQPGDETYDPASKTRPFNLRQAALSLAGQYSDSAPILDFSLNANLLYAASGEQGLRIFDVTDPALPKPIGQYPSPALTRRWTANISVLGNTAYLANRYFQWGTEDVVLPSFEVLDLTDPAKPALLGSLSLDADPQALQVVGNLAYLLLDTGLLTVDLSNPAAPTLANQMNLDSASAFQVVGSLLYLATAQGLYIYDISTPAAPQEIAWYSEVSPVLNVRVAGSSVYVGAPYGLEIFQGEPTDLKLVGSVPLSARGSGLDLYGDYIFVSEITGGPLDLPVPGGVEVFDASNPARPVRVGGYLYLDASAYKLQVSGEIAYVGGGGGAPLKILKTTLREFPEPRLKISRPGAGEIIVSAPAIPGWQIQGSYSSGGLGGLGVTWSDLNPFFEESDGVRRFPTGGGPDIFFFRLRKVGF